MTTTMQLEVSKARLAREILNTDSAEVIEKVRRAFRRATKAEAVAPAPYTMEEIDAHLDQFEAELEAGTLKTMTCQEANEAIRKELPWLCK